MCGYVYVCMCVCVCEREREREREMRGRGLFHTRSLFPENSSLRVSHFVPLVAVVITIIIRKH